MLQSAPFLRRAFTTSTRRLVGPESPKFVEIPKVQLPSYIPPKRKKGILPKPRNLFPPSQPNKGTTEYIAAATKTPGKPRNMPGDSKPTAFQQWRLNMAEKRRQNLHEGLKELKGRKVASKKRRARVFAERSRRRNAALEKAESEDVKLTLPSVLSTLRIAEKGLPDPNREERLKAMAARMAEVLKAKQEERQHHIHELYMNASNFILTETELDRAIEEGFKEMDIDMASFAGWQRPTVREMLGRNDRGNMTSPDDIGAVVLDVGGALTGGRMPANRNYLTPKNLYGA